MHIVVFYQYYHSPDCPAAARHYTFVQEWSQRHRVTVITGDSWYRRRITDTFAWAPPGVDVRMLNVDYDNRMSTGQRFGAFGKYAVSAVKTGLSVSQPDVIFGTSTPLSAAWAAAKVARLRRTKWVFEVRDLWPDFPIQMGAIRNPIMQSMLRRTERRLYEGASHVIALSTDMEDHVAGMGVDRSRISTIVNGTDFDLLGAISEKDVHRLQDRYGLEGKRVVLYAGTFGRANAINTVLEAAEILRDRPDFRFVFVGSGFREPEVRRAARDEASNVVLAETLPRHAILAWFKLADLTLVPFADKPVLAANSPSKLFDSLGAGTPVMVTNPGWTKSFVETNECGWYVPPENPTAMANQIVEVLSSPWELSRAGVNGRKIAEDRFDRVEMAREVERLMVGG